LQGDVGSEPDVCRRGNRVGQLRASLSQMRTAWSANVALPHFGSAAGFGWKM
jgi:hypothetical protein